MCLWGGGRGLVVISVAWFTALEGKGQRLTLVSQTIYREERSCWLCGWCIWMIVFVLLQGLGLSRFCPWWWFISLRCLISELLSEVRQSVISACEWRSRRSMTSSWNWGQKRLTRLDNWAGSVSSSINCRADGLVLPDDLETQRKDEFMLFMLL